MDGDNERSLLSLRTAHLFNQLLGGKKNTTTRIHAGAHGGGEAKMAFLQENQRASDGEVGKGMRGSAQLPPKTRRRSFKRVRAKTE